MSDTKELIERLHILADVMTDEGMPTEALDDACSVLAMQAGTIARLEAERDAARGVRVSIPTETMEQEFSAHHRRGYAKGRREGMEECARMAMHSWARFFASRADSEVFADAIRAEMEKP